MTIDDFLDLLSTEDCRNILTALRAASPSVTPYSAQRWIEAVMRTRPTGWELAAVALALSDDFRLSANPAVQVTKAIIDRHGFSVL